MFVVCIFEHSISASAKHFFVACCCSSSSIYHQHFHHIVVIVSPNLFFSLSEFLRWTNLMILFHKNNRNKSFKFSVKLCTFVDVFSHRIEDTYLQKNAINRENCAEKSGSKQTDQTNRYRIINHQRIAQRCM